MRKLFAVLVGIGALIGLAYSTSISLKALDKSWEASAESRAARFASSSIEERIRMLEQDAAKLRSDTDILLVGSSTPTSVSITGDSFAYISTSGIPILVKCTNVTKKDIGTEITFMAINTSAALLFDLKYDVLVFSKTGTRFEAPVRHTSPVHGGQFASASVVIKDVFPEDIKSVGLDRPTFRAGFPSLSKK